MASTGWLGDAVRHRRQQLGLSLADLGSRAGIHCHTLKDIEDGRYFPSTHYLQRLLHDLETSYLALRDVDAG